MNRVALWLFATLPATGAAEPFAVDPDTGNNTFTAVFDAPLGERITAVSSSVSCQLTLDKRSSAASGTCSVPLTEIRVDNEQTKTEHFQQWSTNKKMLPKQCHYEAHLDMVHFDELVPGQPVRFSAEIPFTVCGRRRADGGKERVEGTALLLPIEGGSGKTVKIKAHVEKFSRDRYRVGPQYTDGWLARVQSLASVVADEGTIDLTLFAKEGKSESKPQK